MHYSPLNRSSFSAAILRGFPFSSAQITRRPKLLGYLPMGSSHTHNSSHSAPFLSSSHKCWRRRRRMLLLLWLASGEGARPARGVGSAGGGELRHRLLLLQRLQRVAARAHGSASGNACCCCCDGHVPVPSRRARFFELFSFFLCSLRIGLLDVNGSE